MKLIFTTMLFVLSLSTFAADVVNVNEANIFSGVSKMELDNGFLPAPGEGCMKPAIARAQKECKLAGFEKCDYIANDIKERKKIFEKARVVKCTAYVKGVK